VSSAWPRARTPTCWRIRSRINRPRIAAMSHRRGDRSRATGSIGDVAIGGSGRDGPRRPSPRIRRPTSSVRVRRHRGAGGRCSPRSNTARRSAGEQGSAGDGRRIVTEAAARAASRFFRWTASTTPSISACTGRARTEVRRLNPDGVGGPFRGRSASDLTTVSAADALKHPTWKMGRKITIDRRP